MSGFFDADDFFRTFEELNQEPYINFPTADVVDRNECTKCVLHPFKQLREQLETNMVEVVRCKDCKWYKSIFSWNGNEHKICVREPGEPPREPDDYCSYGEGR